MSVPVAFYAPLKSPRHPDASGDRTMARLLERALTRAGYNPHLASELRTHDRAGDPERQECLRRQGLAEAERLIRLYRAGTLPRPALWFTYHCYYKAPDWTGPAVSDALAIPYVVAEGSRAGKRAGGPWAIGHAGAEAALDQAAIVFAITPEDAEALRAARVPGQLVLDLPAFLDLNGWPTAAGRAPPDRPVRLLAVAMMRDGDKLTSFRELAAALALLPSGPGWQLTLVGDGPARPAVEELFAPWRDRVTFAGRLDDRGALARCYREADLLVWPAVNEAYGMALLEAQANGCPVLAGRRGGVASVVRHGETGLLAEPGAAGFASALGALLADPGRLPALGEAAAAFVRSERDLAGAARILGAALRPLAVTSRAA